MNEIPQKFEGKVYFYWWESYGGSLVASSNSPDILRDDYIFLGESEELVVPFKDVRVAAVESLKAQITVERAEHQHRIDILQGRIQELLALEVQS